VGKATIYRRWGSKEALAQELLAELAAPHLAVDDLGDTRREMLAAVEHPMEAITSTPFGPVIRALLSQIASNPTLGDPFRATVVQARRDEIRRVIERGVGRGDLRPDADTDLATELLVGPVYFRLMFGGRLDHGFAVSVVDNVLHGYGIARHRKRKAKR
jgi:AcrR family transcriptional regulator